MSIQRIIEDYYAELQKAFKTGKINFDNLHLDNNVSVIGPNE